LGTTAAAAGWRYRGRQRALTCTASSQACSFRQAARPWHSYSNPGSMLEKRGPGSNRQHMWRQQLMGGTAGAELARGCAFRLDLRGWFCMGVVCCNLQQLDQAVALILYISCWGFAGGHGWASAHVPGIVYLYRTHVQTP
jgi:hypothetical protein